MNKLFIIADVTDYDNADLMVWGEGTWGFNLYVGFI